MQLPCSDGPSCRCERKNKTCPVSLYEPHAHCYSYSCGDLKGQEAHENTVHTVWKFKESKRIIKQDQAEQERIEANNQERASVVRSLDGKTNSEGFFAEASPGKG